MYSGLPLQRVLSTVASRAFPVASANALPPHTVSALSVDWSRHFPFSSNSSVDRTLVDLVLITQATIKKVTDMKF